MSDDLLLGQLIAAIGEARPDLVTAGQVNVPALRKALKPAYGKRLAKSC